MKSISVGMIEAGVAAYERAHASKQGVSAVVATIFNTMDAVRRREERTTPAVAGAYVHQAWPSWRYGPDGKGRVFQRAEDVPEGWTESPDIIHALNFFDKNSVEIVKRGPGRPRKDATP